MLGAMLIIIGIAGHFVKAERYQVKRQSYTGHPLKWGPYILIIVGIFLLISDIF